MLGLLPVSLPDMPVTQEFLLSFLLPPAGISQRASRRTPDWILSHHPARQMVCSFSSGIRKGLTHCTAFQPEAVMRPSSCHPWPYNWLSQSSWQVVTPATTTVTLLPWDSRPGGNPMFRSHDTFRRVRRSVRSLHWDHFPMLKDERLLMPPITSRVHPETASSVLRLVADWTAGSWVGWAAAELLRLQYFCISLPQNRA
jgi:hypothetical protein